MPSSASRGAHGSTLEFRGLISGMDSFDPFDQCSRQPECPAQLCFFPRHLTIIALMIKARQMQDSVQGQNLDFLRQRDVLDDGVLTRNVGGDGDVARQFRALAQFGRWVKTETTTRPLLCSGYETGGSGSGPRHCWSPARSRCREVRPPGGHAPRSVPMRSRSDRRSSFAE